MTGTTWVETTDGAPDSRYVSWSAQWTDANHVIHRAFWTTVEDPHGVPSSPLLPLPDDYAASDPTRMLPLILQLKGASVRYVDYDNVSGYDDARPFGTQLQDLGISFLEVPHIARGVSSP
ncbi:MAG: hypothetical protein H6Q90_4147 [Deltaproteobacteria bacterium]|nr:hypothetical protein [Deltaproteobacteria bacterium]